MRDNVAVATGDDPVGGLSSRINREDSVVRSNENAPARIGRHTQFAQAGQGEHDLPLTSTKKVSDNTADADFSASYADETRSRRPALAAMTAYAGHDALTSAGRTGRYSRTFTVTADRRRAQIRAPCPARSAHRVLTSSQLAGASRQAPGHLLISRLAYRNLRPPTDLLGKSTGNAW